MKKILGVMLIISGLCVFLTGSGITEKEVKGKKVVKIALACPLTGDIADMGQGMKNAATLAIEEENQTSKEIKFELLALDDRSDLKDAVKVANQIISDKDVCGVVGHLNSGCSILASDVYHRHKLVMISPASTNPKLTLQKFTNVFRVCTTDNVQGSSAASFVYKNNLQKAAVIHDKTLYGQGLAEEFQKTFKKLGGKILCFEGINLGDIGDRDFKTLLIKIKGMNPQLIYFGGMYQEGGLISKQAKELGLNIPLVGGDGIYTSEYIKIAGKYSEGDIATMMGAPFDKLPKIKTFREKYKARFPNIDIQLSDPYAYDATKIIIEAVKNVGTDKSEIIDYIKNITYDGITGKTKFDEKGDTLNREITYYRVKDGKWVIINE